MNIHRVTYVVVRVVVFVGATNVLRLYRESY